VNEVCVKAVNQMLIVLQRLVLPLGRPVASGRTLADGASHDGSVPTPKKSGELQ